MTPNSTPSASVRGLCVIVMFLVVIVANANAAVVRGRLERVDPHNGARSPAGGVPVSVRSVNGRSRINPSGQDGMYYIYNVTAGNYYLEVWNRGLKGTPLVYQIQVKEPNTDVPPITVP